MTATGSEAKIDTPSKAYAAAAKRWELIDDLLGGTQCMRDKGERYLPIEDKEGPQEYASRRERSYLYPGLEDAMGNVVSKPFSRAVTVKGEIPEPLMPIIDDADTQGRSFSQLARAVFADSVRYGLSYVLVDFVQNPERRISTDGSMEGSYPYFVHIPAESLFAWRVSDSGMLEQVRVKETICRPAGAYGEQEVSVIRVYTPDGWERWEKGEQDQDYSRVDEGTHTFGSIPIVTFYTERTGYMTADPPMEDLAWLNLAHWQSSSQQRNYLHFVRIGLIFGAGFNEDQVNKGIVIGPTRALLTTDSNAKLGYVEHQGAALDAGHRDLESLEAQMAVRALEPFMKTSGDQTATGRAIDEAHVHASIQEWIRSHEAAWEQCWEMAATWAGVELPEDFSVDIYNEFGLSLRATADVQALIAMRQAHMISHETFLAEVKRRGVLSDSVDVETEAQAVASEGPALGDMGMVDETPPREPPGSQAAA